MEILAKILATAGVLVQLVGIVGQLVGDALLIETLGNKMPIPLLSAETKRGRAIRRLLGIPKPSPQVIKPNSIPIEAAFGTPVIATANDGLPLEERVSRLEKLCEMRLEQTRTELEQRLGTEVQKIRREIDGFRQQLGHNVQKQQSATAGTMRIRCRWLVAIAVGTAMIIAGTWL